MPILFGHRGGAGKTIPENSIEAFEEGLRAGAHRLEIDVRLSADGKVVVIHDEEVGRVSDGHGIVSELDFDRLSGLTLRDRLGRPHPGVRIPLLDEVLGRFPSTHLNIDLKTDQPGLITAVRDIIRRRSAHSRATIASFIPNALESFRMLSPEVPTSAHPEEVRALVLHRFRSMFGAERPELVAERVQIPQHHRGLPLAGRGFIGFFHRIGLAVDVWTINDPRVARRLARRGVDGIVTDHVKIIQEAIGADR